MELKKVSLKFLILPLVTFAKCLGFVVFKYPANGFRFSLIGILLFLGNFSLACKDLTKSYSFIVNFLSKSSALIPNYLSFLGLFSTLFLNKCNRVLTLLLNVFSCRDNFKVISKLELLEVEVSLKFKLNVNFISIQR